MGSVLADKALDRHMFRNKNVIFFVAVCERGMSLRRKDINKMQKMVKLVNQPKSHWREIS